MSVLIKDMEIPTDCLNCATKHRFYKELDCISLVGFVDVNGAVAFSENRHPHCPLIEVPALQSDLISRRDAIATIKELPTYAQPEIIRCKDCIHNGSVDTDCPISWNGKEYCSFAERRTDGRSNQQESDNERVCRFCKRIEQQ